MSSDNLLPEQTVDSQPTTSLSVEEIWENRRKTFEQTLERLNAKIQEAKEKGIPLHDLIPVH